MNPKHKFIAVVFGPLFNFFETSLKLSPYFVCTILIFLVAIPIFKTKSKTDLDLIRKALIILALLIGLIFGVIDTLKIRDVI